MADRLSEPEHSGALRALSEALRAGAKKVRRYEPESLPLISESMDSLGRGAEGWAYGDKMLGPGVNKPLVTEKTLDMLGALPVGAPLKGGAAAKAGLYANALRKDLLASHGTKLHDLVTDMDAPKLPAELYNLSLGITKGKPMEWDESNTLLIPRMGRFDPKDSPSTLSAFDAFTPRWNQGQGVRADVVRETANAVKVLKDMRRQMGDEVPPELESLLNAEQGTLAQAARGRLVDRHVSQFPKGGQYQEASGVPPKVYGLPRYGAGGYGKHLSIMADEVSDTPMTLAYGKRFPSFKDYEKSPIGAARLQDPRLQTETEAYEDIKRLFRDRKSDIESTTGLTVPDLNYGSIGQNSRSGALLKLLAQDDTTDPKLRQHAQELIRNLRKTRSEYGELKVFGPVGLHSDNFAGIIANAHHQAKALKALEAAAKKRGLEFDAVPFETTNLSRTGRFNIAKEMQEARK